MAHGGSGRAHPRSGKEESAAGGTGPAEVGKMVAKAPTCSMCGAVIIGYGWSEELKFTVQFCPQCREREAVSRPTIKTPVLEREMLDEAA